MNAVLNIITPVLGLGLLGYIAAKLGWFSDNSIEGLSRYVFDWAVPALLIRSFINTDLPASFPWQLLAAFYLPAYTIYFFTMWVGIKLFNRDFGGGVMTGFSCSFGNSVLLGIPLIMLSFGDQASVPFFILLSFHGLSYFTLTTVLLTYNDVSGEEKASVVKTLKGLYKNPIIIGLVVGVFMNRMHFTLPGPIDKMAEYLQLSVTPCALFALGASLSRHGIVGQVPQTLFVVFMKNLFFPFAVWLLGARVFSLPELWIMVAVILAATPTGINAFLFAERFNTAKALTSTSVFVSTTVSIFSLSLILYLFAVG